MPKSYINGFGGNITFAGQALDVAEWEITATGEAVDSTNTGDGGWDSNILGSKAWEASCKAYYDSAAVPTGAAGYVNGARGSATFLEGNTAKAYSGTVQIVSIKPTNVVKGINSFDVSFKGSGSLTFTS